MMVPEPFPAQEPRGSAQPPTPQERDWCDLCPAPCPPDPAVFEATGLNICPKCLEAML